jgi:hypothetical protein
MTKTVVSLVNSSNEAERMVNELTQKCGCSRSDITLAAQGPQSELTGRGTTGERSGGEGGTLITVQAKSEEAAQCAAQIMNARPSEAQAESAKQAQTGTIRRSRLRAAKPGSGPVRPSYDGPERRKRNMSFSGLDRRAAMQ